MLDPVEADLARYMREESRIAAEQDWLDKLTDKKWAQIEKEVVGNLESLNSWDDEFTIARPHRGRMVESAYCFVDLLTEHLENSERLQRLFADLISQPQGAAVRVALGQLHAAAHAHNLAQAEMSE